MDFKKNHGIRRRIVKLLEERQAAESHMVDEVRMASLDYYKQMLEIVTTWLESFDPDSQIDQLEAALTQNFSSFSLNNWLDNRTQLLLLDKQLEQILISEQEAIRKLKNIKGGTLWKFTNPRASPEIKKQVASAKEAVVSIKVQREGIQRERNAILTKLREQCKIFALEAMQKTDVVKQSKLIGPKIISAELAIASKVSNILKQHQQTELEALSSVQKCLDSLRKRYSDLNPLSTEVQGTTHPQLPSGGSH